MHMISHSRPDPIETDRYKIPFKPGDRVAYVRSGYIGIGFIVKINKNEWRAVLDLGKAGFKWRLFFSMTITQPGGTTSIVRNPYSFAVI